MGLMVPVLAGYIAYSIADRPGLAVGFTGGLLAANGNALVTDYDWGSLNGFQQFVANFAFQGENGGPPYPVSWEESWWDFWRALWC